MLTRWITELISISVVFYVNGLESLVFHHFKYLSPIIFTPYIYIDMYTLYLSI